ncbi:LysR family transcriptional regulator [Rhizobium sp. CG5]|uniref:LysR substrate-binding domain-containing protein n=1 Tax=Rhizobium sp. CG5 TaxID=2726076 RepID=UPI0020334498|nr:LysR substrate-binding domain-containing protein [Rhizobium sp. CG5]MCM2472733.1 LysR family transcriptional regulator [Rhizobium sp. CG5]
MVEPVDSLASLRAFVASADARSFKTAGQGLGISSSAVGKAIARLESQLAVTLFHRTTRTISLTEAGTIFLARARRMLDELQAGEAELAEVSGSPRGRLRVSLPLTGSLLTNALAAFAAEHPLVELDLDYSDRLVDVIEEGFDVVIRTGETGDSRLLHKTLGHFEWRLVAAPTYVAAHGLPTGPQDLSHHVCLRQKLLSGRIAAWPLRSAPGLNVPVSLTASVIDPLLDLTLRGAGIGCFPQFLVRDGLANGALVPVLEGELEQAGVLTMLWPASRFRVPKVRAFVDYVGRHVKADVGSVA